MAACLLMAYVWLGISGGLSLIYGHAVASFYYDAFLHTLFLGFAFSMIFAHAPIILPSILGVSLTYHPVFYVHVALLQVSLALRVIGDIGVWVDVRRWGGLLNVAVILLFMGTMVWAILRGKTGRSSTQLTTQIPAKPAPCPTPRRITFWSQPHRHSLVWHRRSTENITLHHPVRRDRPQQYPRNRHAPRTAALHVNLWYVSRS